MGTTTKPWPLAICETDARAEIAERSDEAVSDVEWMIQVDRASKGKHYLPRGKRYDVRRIAIARIRSADQAGLRFDLAEEREDSRPTWASLWSHELGAWTTPAPAARRQLPAMSRGEVDPAMQAELSEQVALARTELGDDTVDGLMSGDSTAETATAAGINRSTLFRMFERVRAKLRCELSRCGKVTVADPLTVRRTLPHHAERKSACPSLPSRPSPISAPITRGRAGSYPAYALAVRLAYGMGHAR